MNYYNNETPPPPAALAAQPPPTTLSPPPLLPPPTPPQPTKNYIINRDLIRLSSQRIKMPFDRMKRGDTFWVIGHEKITTKFQEQQNIWHTSLEEPTISREEKCFVNSTEYMFYQGAGTNWMDNITQHTLDKLHNRKLCFELEFIDITPKGCFHLKATGRQAEYDYMLD